MKNNKLRIKGADTKLTRDKLSARDTWRRAAPSWHNWIGTISRWISPATESMLDKAGISEGKRVLDLAAGDGDQSLKAARLVGASGYVLATDLTPRFLHYATRACKEAGLTQMETRIMDVEHLELDDNSFDAAICRLGLMFLPDKARGLSEIRRVLKPSGRFAAIVFSKPENNLFLSIPIEIIQRRKGNGETVSGVSTYSGAPGVLSLAEPGALSGLFADAGFRDIHSHTVSTQLKFESAEICLRFDREAMGGIHHYMNGMSRKETDDTWKEIGEALKKMEGPNGFVSPTEWIVVSGVK